MSAGRNLVEVFTKAPARSRTALLVLLAALLVLPLALDRYLLSVMILILYFAYVGQAWNIMMGFCGQLSIGHALFVGLGAYTAAALFQHFGVVPWIGMLAAVAVCVAMASVIGWLAFRFGIGGTYFALLTIAFAEFTRIGFDHFGWVGGSGGFFLRVVQQDRFDLLNLRGNPLMFYYLALGLAAFGFVVSAWLLRGRPGFYFRAIRDNEEAARAAGVDVFRYKMLAVQVSGGLTALAGVFFAFYYNNLFPEQIFGIGRSIEIILAPIIGGIGTLFGPILGAAVLTLASEGINEALSASGYEIPGVKQILYGLALGLAIMFMPHGIWPVIARRLGFGRGSDGDA
ncbi:MAG TPA: branched-chain amino acid ABC transporter permease [Burkholderiaceae bacterium]|nr:branched-chain amino acid ABC transporter permease [Burkholderiaceae bacterium]